MRQRDFVDGSQDERPASCFSPGVGLGKPQAPRAWLPVTRSKMTTKLVPRDGLAVDPTSSAASGRTEFECTAVVVVAGADAGVRCVGIVSSASALDVGSGLAEDVAKKIKIIQTSQKSDIYV